jgi:hypothetical protein
LAQCADAWADAPQFCQGAMMTKEQFKRFWIGFFSVPLFLAFFVGNFLIANYYFEAGSPAWLAVAFWWVIPIIAWGIGIM